MGKGAWGLVLCTLAVAPQALADEWWLVELEGDDGVRLQFKGAELERGSAGVWQDGALDPQPLRPGDRLAILVGQGVALRIERRGARQDKTGWRRGQDRLRHFDGRHIELVQLGRHRLASKVQWHNGGPGDLQPGRELILTRGEQGLVQGVLIPNPEADPAEDW